MTWEILHIYIIFNNGILCFVDFQLDHDSLVLWSWGNNILQISQTFGCIPTSSYNLFRYCTICENILLDSCLVIWQIQSVNFEEPRWISHAHQNYSWSINQRNLFYYIPDHNLENNRGIRPAKVLKHLNKGD